MFIGALSCLMSCAKPVADFIIEQDNTTVPATISFENNSKDAESYVWYFGDGNSSTEISPENRYLLSGKYEVTLVAKKGGKESAQKKDVFLTAPNICLVEMETNMGNMLIQLYDDTPQHRDNFIKLAEEGYYNDLLFHRVIKNFMVQGGDPQSKKATKGTPLGSGGPGYTVEAEFDLKYAHVKGAIAAARTGDNVNPEKRSSGSQFYIVHGKETTEEQLKNISNQKGFDYPKEVVNQYLKRGGTPFLDQSYTVYGKVIGGLEIIDKIAESETDPRDRPATDVKILRVNIIK